MKSELDLDRDTHFNVAVNAAVALGMTHVASGASRVRSDKMVWLVAQKVGPMKYRRFHQEILNRAYGLAFVNAKKMAWVAARKEVAS